MNFSILNLIIILGSIQGFLLALVFLTNKQFNKRSNQFLALLIISLSMPNFLSALRASNVMETYPILEYLPLYFLFLIPFSLYYFIQYLIQPDYTFEKKEYLFLLPFGLQLIHQSSILILYLMDSPYLNSRRNFLWYCGEFFEGGALIATIVVIFIIIKKLNGYEESLLDTYANIESRSMRWLKNTMIASLVLWACWFIPFMTSYGLKGPRLYYPLFLGLALVSYWLAYAVYSRRDIFENSEILSEEAKLQPPVQELSNKTDEHYQKLLTLIEAEKLFKNPDISMTLLAAKMKLSNGYLSQIINQKEEKNFFDFINTYRVEEVKRNLSDPNFDHFSILGIGLEAGFKSKSTFNAVFKKMTGHTPTAYKKLLMADK
ncbi:MAG: helix-turn-helix domain-containing protein [Bacteroidota bacterium]